jgi:excisionase family DNA binding protein
MDLADSLEKRATALTVSDVASLLNISERQVYKLAADGRIPSFKIGNSIRFDPSAFAAWLRQKVRPASWLPRRNQGVGAPSCYLSVLADAELKV